MKLVASVMVGPGESERYLRFALDHLATFCDEVRIRNEFMGAIVTMHDGPFEVLPAAPTFFEHEGRARQELLDWTLEARPTHILAIDADELVSDGEAIRAACEFDAGNGAWTLPMEEVWAADDRYLWTRQDGGWRTHPVPILYRVPDRLDGRWRIQDRALACGREPMAVRQLASKATPTGASCLHLGWLNKHTRAARHQRYVEADGGKFHTSSHLASIMWDDRKVRLRRQDWPATLLPYKPEILERGTREAATA